MPPSNHCFRLELVSTRVLPTLKIDRKEYSVHQITVPELLSISDALADYDFYAKLPAGRVARAKKCAKIATNQLPHGSPATKVLPLVSVPYGPLWKSPRGGEYYFHPATAGDEICVGYDNSGGRPIWWQFKLRRVALSTPLDRRAKARNPRRNKRSR